MSEKLPVEIPSHLAYHITKKQWDFIVEKTNEWEAHAARRGLYPWMLPNWMITFAMNPDEVNRLWIMDRLKQEGACHNHPRCYRIHRVA